MRIKKNVYVVPFAFLQHDTKLQQELEHTTIMYSVRIDPIIFKTLTEKTSTVNKKCINGLGSNIRMCFLNCISYWLSHITIIQKENGKYKTSRYPLLIKVVFFLKGNAIGIYRLYFLLPKSFCHPGHYFRNIFLLVSVQFLLST